MNRGNKISDLASRQASDAELAAKVLFWGGNGPGPEYLEELTRRRSRRLGGERVEFSDARLEQIADSQP